MAMDDSPTAPRPLLRDHSLQAMFMGLLVAFVGFGSSFAVVLQGLKAVGASDAEAASGLMAAGLSMGLVAIVLSVATRLPISCAWSTPGAAMMAGAVAAGTASVTFAEAVAGFIVCGMLIVATGMIGPLGRLVAMIPAPLANAMLAGVLLPLCLAPFRAIGFDAALGFPILAAFVLGGLVHKLAGVPAALLAFAGVVGFGVEFPSDWTGTIGDALVPVPIWVTPNVTGAAIFSVALPLWIVTMASQNIPGLAVLHIHGYRPDAGPLVAATGAFTILAAPFGAHATNLAAITAAMCMNEDAHPDPARRYWAAIWGGVFYCVFAALAGATVAFVTLAPAILIEAVAGVALFGALTGAASTAFERPGDRMACAVTFLATASGMSVFGISGAFWGLVLGIAAWAVTHR